MAFSLNRLYGVYQNIVCYTVIVIVVYNDWVRKWNICKLWELFVCWFCV